MKRDRRGQVVLELNAAGMSRDEITEATGVSRATFYRYLEAHEPLSPGVSRTNEKPCEGKRWTVGAVPARLDRGRGRIPPGRGGLAEGVWNRTREVRQAPSAFVG